MKNDCGGGQGRTTAKYHVGSPWHRIANQNGTDDTRILRHWPTTEALLAQWRSDPAITAAEQHCLAWDSARRATILTPATC